MTEKPPPHQGSEKGSPFREPLEPSEFRSSINVLKSLPDKLVRRYEVYAGDEATIKGAVKGFHRGQEVFRTLESRYGVAVPRMDLVLGRIGGTEEMYTVVDRIEGEDLGKIRNLPAESAGEFDHFFSAFARYYSDIFREGGDYWWDLHPSQIVYGRRKGEQRNRVYIVDVDPHYTTYLGFQKSDRQQNLYLLAGFGRVCDSLREVEEKFSPPVRLEQARNVLKKALDSIPKETEGFSSYIPQIKEKIQEEESAGKETR